MRPVCQQSGEDNDNISSSEICDLLSYLEMRRLKMRLLFCFRVVLFFCFFLLKNAFLKDINEDKLKGTVAFSVFLKDPQNNDRDSCFVQTEYIAWIKRLRCSTLH